MGDGRLSDMAILAIEREIMIDLDQTVEQFSKKHINSRILLLWENIFCFFVDTNTFLN